MVVRALRLAALLLTVALLLQVTVSAQTYRVGADFGRGVVVELPEIPTTTGYVVKRGVPTVVIFAQVKGCDLCTAIPDITARWLEAYPDMRTIVVETHSPRADVEAWGEAHDVGIVFDEFGDFRKAFATNLTHVYLLDASGTIRDKMRPIYRQQWVAFDAQLARANAGDWAPVDAHSAALPPLGGVAAGSSTIPLGTGSPTAVVLADGYCSDCREFLSKGLQKTLNELLEQRPDIRVYFMEPSLESMAEGFYGTLTRDYGPKEAFQEFVDLFGEEAAGPEIMKYLQTGELTYFLPKQLWPTSGWAEGVTVIQYEVGGPDDPLNLWRQRGEQLGLNLLVFDGEGRYVGPAPFFEGSTAKSLVTKIEKLSSVD